MENIHKKIIDTLIKYNEYHNLDIQSISEKLNLFKFASELKTKYGLNVKPDYIYSMDWQAFHDDCVHLGLFGGRRTISCEDNNKPTPQGKHLIRYGFSSGAYMFGSAFGDNDYPADFFMRFWNELKSYNPDYIDTRNNNMYFELENAAPLFNAYPEIINRYTAENELDRKKRKAERLRQEIERLENI